MSDFSFDIKSSRDFFKKLLEDHKDFIKEKTSSRFAINCAMTSWHLTDWVFNENKTLLEQKFKKELDFKKYIKELCPSLQIMQDITNGSKHFLITHYSPKVKETNLHKGAFSSAFSSGFDISGLHVIMNDGSKIYFETAIDETVNFWTTYLKDEINL